MLPSAPGASASGPQASPPPTGKLVMSPLVVMRPMRSPRLVNHSAPSAPVTMASGASISPAGSRYRVISPPGVMRPSWARSAVNQTLPSGPTVRSRGASRRPVWVGEGCHARQGALSSYYRHRAGRRHRRRLRFRHRRIPTASASGEDNRYQRRGADRCCKYKRKTSRTRSLQRVRTLAAIAPPLALPGLWAVSLLKIPLVVNFVCELEHALLVTCVTPTHVMASTRDKTNGPHRPTGRTKRRSAEPWNRTDDQVAVSARCETVAASPMRYRAQNAGYGASTVPAAAVMCD